MPENSVDAHQELTETLSVDSRDTSGSWAGVCFLLGGWRFVVASEKVGDVLPVPDAVPLPGVQPWLVGITSQNGFLLPVVDLPGFLGESEGSRTQESRIVVLEQEESRCAVIVDAVEGAVQLPIDQLSMECPDDLFRSVRRFVTGVFAGKSTFVVLDVRTLMNDPAFLHLAI